jgi:hypothetical protein
LLEKILLLSLCSLLKRIILNLVLSVCFFIESKVMQDKKIELC